MSAMQTRTPAVKFNWRLMAEDAAAKGMQPTDVARKAGVSDMSVLRFFRDQQQTARMAKKLARAIGRGLDRYVIRSQETAVA